jgi:hypothetical protein
VGRGVLAEKIGNLFKKIRLSELPFFVLCVELICGGMCELSPFFLNFFFKVLIANGSSDCVVAL